MQSVRSKHVAPRGGRHSLAHTSHLAPLGRPQCQSTHVLYSQRPGQKDSGVVVRDLSALSGMYRRGVGICLVNSQGLVFAAQRCDDDANTWQMPQVRCSQQP